MKPHVLIADSDADAVEAYRDHLYESDYGVAVASNGVERLRRLRDMPLDILVLGAPLHWGGCDGVLTMMHQEPELRPPYVMLLASGEDQRPILRGTAAEINDYQRKPLSPCRLAERLQTVLDQYSTDDSLTPKE